MEPIHLETRSLGNPSHPAVVIIAGAGATQNWSFGIDEGLATRGFHVITFDNRDVGGAIKSKVEDPINLYMEMTESRRDFDFPWSFKDMAEDVVRVLDKFRIERAHVLGISMGGMLSQIITTLHPSRFYSAIHLITGYDEEGVAEAAASEEGKALAEAMGNAPQVAEGCTREEFLQQRVAMYSPLLTCGVAKIREMAAKDFDKGWVDWDGSGATRQGLAWLKWCPKLDEHHERLKKNEVPTLIIHGRKDPVQAFSQAEKLKACIKGAELVAHDGGHNLGDQETQGRMLDKIASFAKGAAAGRRKSAL